MFSTQVAKDQNKLFIQEKIKMVNKYMTTIYTQRMKNMQIKTRDHFSSIKLSKCGLKGR